MSYDAAPSLVLRPARGAHVAHLVLRVEPGQGGEALRRLAGLLRDELPPSFGLDAPADDRLQCSVGFTCYPPGYYPRRQYQHRDRGSGLDHGGP